MAKRKQKASIQQWVCDQLDDFYEDDLQPSDLLAVKQVHHDVIVIGPDGRKFRLQQGPEDRLIEKEMEKVP